MASTLHLAALGVSLSLACGGGRGSAAADGAPGLDAVIAAPDAVVARPDAVIAAPDAAIACAALLEPAPCGDCVEVACCAELAACQADATCGACLVAYDPVTCGVAGALLTAATTCADQAQAGGCAEACAGATACNPVTSAECTAAGAVCDLDGAGSYACFGPPNTLALCDACPSAADAWCGAGLTCLDGVCARFCCGDEDCGTGTCDLTAAVQGVGVCLDGDGAAACDAPLEAPSGGACWNAPP